MKDLINQHLFIHAKVAQQMQAGYTDTEHLIEKTSHVCYPVRACTMHRQYFLQNQSKSDQKIA